MSINSKKKGSRGELELSHILNEYGYETKRSQQYCGANGDDDVTGIDGLHIECKRVEKLNIDTAMEQALADVKEGEMPSVFHRKNRKPWKVTVILDDFMKLWKAYELYNFGGRP